MRLGFACSWDSRPEATWSHTPWNLRSALREQADLHDLGLRLPDPLRHGLRAMHVRKAGDRWTSTWKHSSVTRRLVESTLRHRAAHHPSDVVLQIQDLARFDQPYLVFQDLSYDVLLQLLDGQGALTHFPGLRRAQIVRLRDRQRRIYAGAAGVLAMSNWFAEHLVRHSDVSADRVHVVHPGATAAAGCAQAPIRRSVPPHMRLLFVGKDFATKGGEQVLGALRLLRADVDPDATLTVVGPVAWPRDGGPPEGVRFLGRLPVEHLPAIYAEHDAFVMPSHFEGFGIAFVEALAHGLPCVARDAFAMPEIVRHGQNGTLVATSDPGELAQAIMTAVRDPAIRDTVAAEAAGVRAHYSWSRAAADVVTVAESVA